MSGIKTFSNETSERYALALFELANEKSELEGIEKDITFLLEICKNNLDFNNHYSILINTLKKFDELSGKKIIISI